MRIQIDYEVSPAAFARIEQLIADTEEHDVDFNGANIVIERGAGTFVVDDAGICGYDVARLFSAVQSIVARTWEEPAGYRKISTGKLIEINA